VTPTLIALLAAFGSVVMVTAVGTRRVPDLLADSIVARDEDRATPDALARVGRWPILRRIGISQMTSSRLDLIGAGWDERAVVAAKATLTVAVALGSVLMRAPVVAAPVALIAWRIPDLLIARLARAKLSAADREIPVLLDLLAVATSAGLPPPLAFRRAVDAATGPLARELRSVINASDLGGRWRAELASVGERLDLPDLRRLLGSLARTDALGTSLAEEIARLASDVREVRRAAATQRARTAPVKMLFPLVFLVLPAFLLLTVVPVLLTTVASIG
jgi:Flp pilus assembly protein TadB